VSQTYRTKRGYATLSRRVVFVLLKDTSQVELLTHPNKQEAFILVEDLNKFLGIKMQQHDNGNIFNVVNPNITTNGIPVQFNNSSSPPPSTNYNAQNDPPPYSVVVGDTHSNPNIAEELSKLKNLLDAGAINDEEFQKAKQKLLS